MGALSHIRVLDLSRILAGPWAGQTLADLGAEVIKVERPGSGDDTRRWGPPWLKTGQGAATGESAYYLCANRGKRSVTIDITDPEGQALVRRLADKSDILLENFKVGGLEKYGLDYPRLRRSNPRLIYCSITGFGQSGPCRNRAGYDSLIQAMGGLMSITGEADPNGGPQKVGVAVADVLTGLYASTACLAALAYREQSGQGQHIDLALLDVQVAALANQASGYLVSGEVPGRMGNAHPSIVPYQPFATADGQVVVAVGNDAQFSRLCDLLGRPDLAVDPDFATNAARVAHRERLLAILEPLLRTRSSAAWIERLEAASIPCGPINRIDQVFAHPQIRARGMRIECDHPLAGKVPLVASPIRMSASPVETGAAPPLLGADTDQVLETLLGIGRARREELRAKGVISRGPGR